MRELSDSEAYQLALVENLIREDLNPIEEALGYQTLAEEYNLTQEQIAEKVGRSRPAIANAMRLLSLPEEVISLLKKGKLSAGHARALLTLDAEVAVLLANRIVSEDLSVRQTEQLAKQLKIEPVVKVPKKVPSFYREMELALKDSLSRRVRVSHKGEEKGELVIEFYSREELEEFAKKLTGN